MKQPVTQRHPGDPTQEEDTTRTNPKHSTTIGSCHRKIPASTVTMVFRGKMVLPVLAGLVFIVSKLLPVASFVSPAKDETGTVSQTKITVTPSSNSGKNKYWALFATTANPTEDMAPRYSVGGGNTAISGTDLAMLTSESFYESNPCASYPASSVSTACPARDGFADFTFGSCPTPEQTARDATLSFSQPVRTVWVIAFHCLKSGGSTSVHVGPAIYGPYVLKKICKIIWKNDGLTGTSKRGGDTVSVELTYENPVVITGPIQLRYYKLKVGMQDIDANYEFVYDASIAQDGDIPKPSHASDTATSTSSFVISKSYSLPAGTYKILAQASAVASGSDAVKTFSDKFTLQPTIDVVIPASKLTGGVTYGISWTISNLGPTGLKIALHGADSQEKHVFGEYSPPSREGGTYDIKVPENVVSGSGYYVVLTTLETQPPYTGESATFSISPALSVITDLAKSVSGRFDEHTEHFHGSDKIEITWTSTNDPEYKNKWDVLFDLCKGTVAVHDCTLMQEPLASTFGALVYSKDVPGTASLTVPPESTILPAPNYYVRVRSKTDASISALSPNAISIVGTIELSLKVHSDKLSVIGDQQIQVTWSSRNLNGNILLYMCDKSAPTTAHTSCEFLRSVLVSTKESDIVVPSTDKFVHAVDQYRVGAKSEVADAGTFAPTLFSITGSIAITRPVGGTIYTGGSLVPLVFTYGNLPGYLNVTLCRSTAITHQEEGACISLDNGLNLQQGNTTYVVPSSPAVFAASDSYYLCCRSVSFPSVVTCSSAFTVEAVVDIDLLGQGEVSSGDTMGIKYEAKNVVGELVMHLCSPIQCFPIADSVSSENGAITSFDVSIPKGKEILYRTDYRLKATPKFRALAPSYSPLFTIKPKISMEFRGSQTGFRGGDVVNIVLISAGVDANVSLNLCWNGASSCHTDPLLSPDSVLLNAAVEKEFTVTWPRDLELFRSDYFVQLKTHGCHPKSYDCLLLQIDSHTFTIIENSPPKLESLTLDKSRLFPLSAGVECVPGQVSDPNPEQANYQFTFTYQWQRAPENKLSFENIVGETQKTLLRNWDAVSGKELNLIPGSKLRCVVSPKDQYDTGLPVTSKTIEVLPLDMVRNGNTITLSGGTSFKSTTFECVFPYKEYALRVAASPATDGSSTVCNVPEWNYPHGSVASRLETSEGFFVSYVAPSIQFSKKQPQTPTFEGFQGRAEQTSTLSIKWIPSRYADGSWEPFDSFELAANRSDGGGVHNTRKSFLPTWDFSKGPLDSNFKPTTVALHDMTGLLGEPATYRVAVRTKNIVGYSSWSVWSDPVPMQQAKRPSQPSTPQVFKVNAETIFVGFSEPSDARGSPVESYEIDVGVENLQGCGGYSWTRAKKDAGDCSDPLTPSCYRCLLMDQGMSSMHFACSSLSRSEKYVFRVYAKNGATWDKNGLSEASDVTSPPAQLNDLTLDIYVDPVNGQDGDCTSGDTYNKPCLTLNHAVAQTQGNKGQKLFLRPGNYVLPNPIKFSMAGVSLISTNGPEHTIFHCGEGSCLVSDEAVSTDSSGGKKSTLNFPAIVKGITFQNASKQAAMVIGVRVSSEGWPRMEHIIRIEDCIFKENRMVSKSAGAAMNIMNAANVTIFNCSFTDNFASDGGALDIQSSSVMLELTEFFMNNASANGGAMTASSVSTYDRTMIKFLTLTFKGNKALENGGAAYLDSVDITQCESVVFDRNKAASEGGALYLASSTLNAQDTSFVANEVGDTLSSAVVSGGAIKCIASKSVVFTESEFIRNKAISADSADGGVISTIYCTITLIKSEATDNVATRHGGVFHLTGSSNVISEQSTFIGNSATSNGGTVFCSDCNANGRLVSTVMLNSSAAEGGCIALYGTKSFQIKSSSLIRCVATGPTGGAGLYVGAGAMANGIEVTQTTVKECTAHRGGGALLWRPGRGAFTAPPLLLDGVTKAEQRSNVALYGAFIASEAFRLEFSPKAISAFSNTTSGAPMDAWVKGQIVDFYGSTVSNDDTTVMSVLKTTNGVTFHKNFATQQKAEKGVIILEGFAVYALPGSAGSITLVGANMEQRPNVIAASSRLCSPGEFTDATAQLCRPCTPGKFTDIHDSSNCDRCSIGMYANEYGSTQCSRCPVGRYGKSLGMSECNLCETGKFSEELNSTSCKNCIGGQFIATEGAIACKDCTIGKYSSLGSDSCQRCEVGKMSQVLGAKACETCRQGTYNDELGQSDCKVCEQGKHGVLTDGITPACALCLPGQFSGDEGSTACTLCAEGRFNTLAGRSNCTQCLQGLVAESKGSMSCTSCKSGKYSDVLNPRACSVCPWGQVQPDEGQDACLSCPKGQYSKNLANPVTCSECAPGWYTAQAGSHGCTMTPPGHRSFLNKSGIVPCPPGTISEGLTTQCKQVEPGYFSSAWRATIMHECQVGTFTAESGETQCMDCPEGMFQANTKAKSCQPSNVGYATNRSSGSSSQVRCLSGSFSKGSQAYCTSCKAGTYSFSGSAYCTTCDPGMYSSSDNAAICTPCPLGKWSEFSNSSTCDACPPGKYGNGFEKCLKCETGKFSTMAGGSSCQACPKGKTSLATGSVSCVLCEPGKYAEQEMSISCKDCPVNEYADESASEQCKTCPAKSWTLRSLGASQCTACAFGEVFPLDATNDCLLCRPESYSFYPGENIEKQCHPCPEGASCRGGGNVKVRVGYWRNHKYANVMNPCLIPEACLGVRRVMDHPFNAFAVPETWNGSDTCAEGHTGPICNSCSKGYGKTGRTCTLCGNAAVEHALAAGRMAFMYIVLTYLVFSTMKNSMAKVRSPKMTVLKILLSHIQILSLNSAYGIDWPPLVVSLMSILDVLGYIDALFPLDCGMQGSDYFMRTGMYLLLPFFYAPVAMVYISLRNKCAKKRKKDPKSTSVVPIGSPGPNGALEEENVSQNPDDVTLTMKLEALVVISALGGEFSIIVNVCESICSNKQSYDFG